LGTGGEKTCQRQQEKETRKLEHAILDYRTARIAERGQTPLCQGTFSSMAWAHIGKVIQARATARTAAHLPPQADLARYSLTAARLSALLTLQHARAAAKAERTRQGAEMCS